MAQQRRPYRKKDVVREDILRAAEELFATRSPSSVSLREIAEHGGFQHSLITRHFGTKDELLAEVIRRTLDSYIEAVRDCDDPVDGYLRALEHVAAHPASFHAMALALIDSGRPVFGDDLEPGFALHRDRLRASGASDDEVDLDVLTVALMAFASGWAFMEDRWLQIGGFEDTDRTRVRAQLGVLIRRLIEDR